MTTNDIVAAGLASLQENNRRANEELSQSMQEIRQALTVGLTGDTTTVLQAMQKDKEFKARVVAEATAIVSGSVRTVPK